MKYSFLSLARNALSYHERWPLAWRSPQPKRRYDAVVVGGGGHGLATAYYLAKEHGLTNIAVLEKGYIGGGNTGRNTTIVRSNYHLDPNAQLYEFSLKLWESLSQFECETGNCDDLAHRHGMNPNRVEMGIRGKAARNPA